MRKIILTEEALAFEQKSQELIGKVVKNIFYKHDVEGYINTKAKGEKRSGQTHLKVKYFFPEAWIKTGLKPPYSL